MNDIILLNSIRLEKAALSLNDEKFATIRGEAAHFGRPNLNNEIVDAKSFDATFALIAETKRNPAFTYNHVMENVIGGWDLIECRENCLYVEGRISRENDLGRNLLPLIESGDISGLSTEGRTRIEDVEERPEGLYLRNFYLTAISLVTLPADPDSYINIANEYRAYMDRVGTKAGRTRNPWLF